VLAKLFEVVPNVPHTIIVSPVEYPGFTLPLIVRVAIPAELEEADRIVNAAPDTEEGFINAAVPLNVKNVIPEDPF
jgi:hypothetical protein